MPNAQKRPLQLSVIARCCLAVVRGKKAGLDRTLKACSKEQGRCWESVWRLENHPIRVRHADPRQS